MNKSSLNFRLLFALCIYKLGFGGANKFLSICSAQDPSVAIVTPKSSHTRFGKPLFAPSRMTNASVTSRGFNASKGSARHSRAKCRARSEESCAADE